MKLEPWDDEAESVELEEKRFGAWGSWFSQAPLKDSTRATFRIDGFGVYGLSWGVV